MSSEDNQAETGNAQLSLRQILVRRGIPLGLIVVLAAMLVGLCGGSDGRVSVPKGAQAGDLILHDCTAGTRGAGNVDADCGTLVVPENRSDPASRLIALPITRIRATGSDPTEPIFWSAGRPWHLEHGLLAVRRPRREPRCRAGRVPRDRRVFGTELPGGGGCDAWRRQGLAGR